jgi:hypothetical protein
MNCLSKRDIPQDNATPLWGLENLSWLAGYTHFAPTARLKHLADVSLIIYGDECDWALARP